MKRKRARLAFVLVIFVILVGGLWTFIGCASLESTAEIFGSGFIEAKDVAVAFEFGGRIVDITASEGDRIEAGVALIKLDDSLLKAEEQQADAALAEAQAGLQQAIASRNQAIVSRDGAKKVWENALDVQRNPLELETRIIATQGELDMAELNLKRVAEIEKEWNLAGAEIQLDTARKVLENFRKAEHTLGLGSSYDRKAKTLPAEGELAVAELNLAYEIQLEKFWRVPSAELRRDNAQNALENLLAIRDNPQDINAAADQAHVAYQTAVAAVDLAEKAVEVAKARVQQAEASLDVIRVQLNKLTVTSPLSGVVAAQHAEVDEIAQPGVPILTITELEEVTLTAYVSESKIGLVKLGQKVLVSVDSYPDDSFSGEVVYISPRALFTPGNIQLKEEREKMVFAVKISLANPEQKLKPGMPADARILTNSEG
ncbi:MAG: efflux RND transporter periplasmic adaptor subunit [Dehalococcoidales bacterium]